MGHQVTVLATRFPQMFECRVAMCVNFYVSSNLHFVMLIENDYPLKCSTSAAMDITERDSDD